MIEHKDLERVQQHLISLGLQYKQPQRRGGAGYWVCPETWDDSKRCPFAIVVRPNGWHFEFWVRVCNKFFELGVVDQVLSITVSQLNQLIDRALESEFYIAQVQKKTMEVVEALIVGCVHVE